MKTLCRSVLALLLACAPLRAEEAEIQARDQTSAKLNENYIRQQVAFNEAMSAVLSTPN